MCKIFINADVMLYTTRSRSLRLHGLSTSIRLENMFWDVLEEIAGRDGMTTNQLIATLYDELTEHGVDMANFTSFLRVSCVRYLSLQLAGRIQTDRGVPIRSLNADWVLDGRPGAAMAGASRA